MSLNSNHPLESTLTSNITQLKKLKEKDDQKHDSEISSILLWIASNHPDLFDSNDYGLEGVYVRNYYVRRLYFSKSWEFPDELINTGALNTILCNYNEIKGICGYMDPCILEHLDEEAMEDRITIKLALGKHINVGLLIEKLNKRRMKHLRKHYSEDDIAIHLRCGELDLKDLTPLPNNEPKLYISDVSDQDTNWVVQAALALLPKPAPSRIEHSHMEEPYFGALKLPRSKLTQAGVESIAKGISDLHILVEEFQVSSPHFEEDEELSGDEDQSGDEDPSSNFEEFCAMISKKYNIDLVSFDDDKGLEFIQITDFLSDYSDDKYMYGYGRLSDNNDDDDDFSYY